ncbi:DHH family phosphoesterase [Spiroplasma chrysopicola]|uniref:DHH family protein n=1 Tax=Spiroplasma chrysopicola DF-1 TaxID=1276227 RepID=R4U9S6_9MOLU|nr:bifunctional oligoribonuclease/PAP phosphatase NrnA [Spiroplasma chrysopicola]AGM24619.1 DHH family protein [Spiroplasma chrysopicola DF-1]
MEKTKALILEKIKNHNKIICLRHVSPDGDAYGSAFGLAQFIKDNYPTKKVLVDGQPNPYLNFLATPDIVHNQDYEGALIIITDTANEERIDSPYWKLGKTVIKIDHHPNKTSFGDIQWVEDERVSASEMVAELLFESNLTISPQTAKLLLTGIITDSNRYMYKKTSSQTLMLASQLLAKGVDAQAIYQNLYNETWHDAKLKNYLFAKIEYASLGIAYIKVNHDMLVEHKMEYEQVKSWVNLMSSIKEFKIWVIFVENKAENYINVSIRSSKYIINEVAEKHHGGGHQLAAGAKIYQWDDVKKVIKDLEEVIRDNKII